MKLSSLGAACAVVSLAAVAALPATAASLTAGYNVSAVYSTCQASGAGSGALTEGSAGCADRVASGSFLVSGSGDATYDTLRATARVGLAGLDPNLPVSGSSTLASAQGTARYDDRLTIDVAGRTGEIVELVFNTELNGTMMVGGDADFVYTEASGGLVVRVNGVNVSVSRNAKLVGESNANDFNPGVVQIVLGTPFAVSAELQARARLFPTVTSGGAAYTGDAVADFGNSGGITSFQLFEVGGGALIPGWELTSESGQFGFYTAVVPVPAAGWLLGSALATAGALRRVRRSARQR